MMKKIDAVKHELNPMSLMALVLSFISLAIVSSLLFIPKTERACSLFLGSIALSAGLVACHGDREQQEI